MLLEDKGQYNRLMQKRYNASQSTVTISYTFRKQRALVNSKKW
jgi:hypothetical protein